MLSITTRNSLGMASNGARYPQRFGTLLVLYRDHSIPCHPQELHDNQKVILTEFSDEGLSATIMFHAGKGSEGHMDTYLVRGMVRSFIDSSRFRSQPQNSSVLSHISQY